MKLNLAHLILLLPQLIVPSGVLLLLGLGLGGLHPAHLDGVHHARDPQLLPLGRDEGALLWGVGRQGVLHYLTAEEIHPRLENKHTLV